MKCEAQAELVKHLRSISVMQSVRNQSEMFHFAEHDIIKGAESRANPPGSCNVILSEAKNLVLIARRFCARTHTDA